MVVSSTRDRRFRDLGLVVVGLRARMGIGGGNGIGGGGGRASGSGGRGMGSGSGNGLGLPSMSRASLGRWMGDGRAWPVKASAKTTVMVLNNISNVEV